MTDAELLTKIKNGPGITGAFQGATLTVYVDEVKAFMKSAGVANTEAVEILPKSRGQKIVIIIKLNKTTILSQS